MTQNYRNITIEEQKECMMHILEDLLDFFSNNNLQYYLIGGSLLGAIRHQGFIPWDDDIDICMPMPDYKKMIQLSKIKPISSRVFLSCIDTNKNHIWPMAKAISNNTRLIEPNVLERYINKQKKFGGVYIDIFPLYGLPNNEVERKNFCKMLSKTYKRYERATRKYNRKNNIKSYIRECVSILISIPYRIKGGEYYLEKIERTTSMYPYYDSNFFAYSCGICPYSKDVVAKEAFADFLEVPFEYLKCRIPVAYNSILTNQYGDYMIPPPPEMRFTHPRDVFWLEERS